ncbi:hypothetical protein [Ruminococcus flavefaciens]|uniref:hypothetical protein n=1 Tax=Ruminococcus flavefaciens TaxID=1265 RepID=UPI0026EC4610|nr:hypothetical protein [Ruminococcus flavefaciens]
MANSIAKFKAYIDLLDEVYKQASCTAVLDGDKTLVRPGANANEIIVPKLSMDGLADYNRNSGYVKGDVTLTMETMTFDYDRGRKFDVDAMDNEETAGVAFGKLSSEFVRTKTTPELDAYRFAKYAGTTGISKVATGATLSTGADVLAAIVAAATKLDEDEVDADNRYLFITPTLLNLAKNVDTTKSKAVLDDFAGIIKVPQSRFYTAIDLKDGTTSGEEAGGYAKAEAGLDINFMIVQKSAVVQYPKHTVNKVVSPEENQSSDGWMFFFRAYGLTDVYDNKVAGIYLHHKAT